VHLVGFVIKKFVTMHGHTNVKKKSLVMLPRCIAFVLTVLAGFTQLKSELCIYGSDNEGTIET
jgi:hypothetical protein